GRGHEQTRHDDNAREQIGGDAVFCEPFDQGVGCCLLRDMRCGIKPRGRSLYAVGRSDSYFLISKPE
ncbi:MAG: hypothetical protein R6U56_02210, partial [Opitutales bacterium]